MSVYLHDVPLPEAQARLQRALQEAGLWRVLAAENIALDENALGRVLAEPVWAQISSPHYHASAMDGFAVRAGETSGAGPTEPVTLPVGPSARYLDTGDPLPGDFDSVIPIENVEVLDEAGHLSEARSRASAIRVRAAVTPWSHVRPMGEDIVATQLVLPRGHVLRPADLGVAAAAGHDRLNVARKPRVAILPTGTELVPVGSKLRPGDILEYNSLVLAAQVKGMGGEPVRFPITEDNFDAICGRVEEASRAHDLILLNAGSSAGMEDFSARVVERLGRLLVHGVAVRPGHPVILGLVRRAGGKGSPEGSAGSNAEPGWVPVIGVPGYPVSAALTADIFVEPLLARWLGRRPVELPAASATLTRKLVSPAGDDDYVRVTLGRVGQRLLAAPLPRGAGVISSLSRADGLLILPRGQQGAEAGQEVLVRLFRSAGELERTILCVGSHDVILDLLAQFLAERGRRLVSSNVGSQAGLVALRRREAHLAGSHLLDPATGEYNIRYIREYLRGVPVRLVALVGREQGLLVKAGNPKNLGSLRDLARGDVSFVNRQRGAGTRVLLDFHLGLLGLSPEQVRGYDHEEYTHLAVAAAVASGRADCGLGIAAAAQALELNFVPLFQERYDLVIPLEHATGEQLSPLFDVLADPEFQREVAALPGYDVSVMGRVMLED